ncbi:hypothetical protein VTK73DRAFT_6899 [Phialemonium thermophilum]|uniref:Uncharacterized protein n=1 Tax=Phialemonium thermophilum TaxID=223376 RepID=A0ABR3WHW0_9PEZI
MFQQPQPGRKVMTISDAFQSRLPNIPQAPNARTGLHSSDFAARHTTPPKFWADRTLSPYVTRAEAALQTQAVRREILGNYMPSMERTFNIRSKADVARAASLYFLHPANIALVAAHPDVDIECLLEISSTGNHVRPDIIYTVKGRVFAVVKFEIMGVIVRGEFDEARLPMTASTSKVNSMIQAAMGNQDRTTFGGNAAKIVKQMAQYSQKHHFNTQYVALFNWDLLFLSVFNSDTTESIHGSLVNRTASDGNNLLKAFFGWLLEAYENLGQSNLSAPGKSGRGASTQGAEAGPGTPQRPAQLQYGPGQIPIAMRTRTQQQAKEEESFNGKGKGRK